jgi:hypothetical protein
MNKISNTYLMITLAILAAAFSRLIPHPINFTPIGAIALFGAAYLNRKHLAYIIPIVAIIFSNLIIDNLIYQPEGFVLFKHYHAYQLLSFVLITALGQKILSKLNTIRLLGASISASLLFFVVTNIGEWLSSGMYERTAEGLTLCFTLAIPFFGNTLLGDLTYCAVLFGSFELVKQYQPKLVRA